MESTAIDYLENYVQREPDSNIENFIIEAIKLGNKNIIERVTKLRQKEYRNVEKNSTINLITNRGTIELEITDDELELHIHELKQIKSLFQMRS